MYHALRHQMLIVLLAATGMGNVSQHAVAYAATSDDPRVVTAPRLPAGFAGGLSRENSDPEWALLLSITHENGLQDLSTGLGFHADALLGYDAYDVPEPPPAPMPEVLRAYADRSAWGAAFSEYDREVQPPLEEGEERSWPLVVEAPSGQIEIAWELPASALTSGLSFELIDEASDQRYVLNPGGSYTFVSDGTARSFTVMIYSNVVRVQVQLLLQGAYDGALPMRVSLSADLPIVDPYGFGQSVATSDFFTTDPAGQQVVDWVWLQLRTGDPAGSMAIEAQRAALLMSDGSIAEADGTSPVSFSGLTAGSYWLVAGHRNHLAVMGGTVLDCTSGACAYDFTTSASQAYGTEPMVGLSGGTGPWALYAGDADADGEIIATDYQNHWRVQNGGAAGYLSADFDLDGEVIATDYQVFWRVNNSHESRVPAAGTTSAAAKSTAVERSTVHPPRLVQPLQRRHTGKQGH